MWVTDPAAWDRLAAALLKAGRAGIDSETWGQPEKTSPQYRTKVHCWSVAIIGEQRSARGYRRAHGVVLPREALFHDALRLVLQRIELWAHNAPHDEHSFANEGADFVIHDTLQWLRQAVPGRTDYGLKGAEGWALGKPARPDYLDMVRYEIERPWTSVRHEKRCVCGAVPCRKPSKSVFLRDGVETHHERVKVPIATEHPRLVTETLPITDFVPGAVLPPLVWNGKTEDRLAAWWRYSVTDAVSGIELVDWLETTVHPRASVPGAPGREYPWS